MNICIPRLMYEYRHTEREEIDKERQKYKQRKW